MWQSTTKDFVRVIKNNNVLIKEIIAGLIQPEWVQGPWGSSPMGPERDSWVFMLGSSAHPATANACFDPEDIQIALLYKVWAFMPQRVFYLVCTNEFSMKF